MVTAVVAQGRKRDELKRFLELFAQSGGEETFGMFSEYIDAEWHQWQADDGRGFDEWCGQNLGVQVDHVETKERGTVTWVEAYHRRWGRLSPEWFADSNGQIDNKQYDEYLQRGVVTAGGWDCTPQNRPAVVSPTCPKKGK